MRLSRWTATMLGALALGCGEPSSPDADGGSTLDGSLRPDGAVAGDSGLSDASTAPTCEALRCPAMSTCRIGERGAACVCDPGRELAAGRCVDIDECRAAPCYPGVVCTDAPAPAVGFTCGACPPGYEGDGVRCTAVCPCFSEADLDALEAFDDPTDPLQRTCQLDFDDLGPIKSELKRWRSGLSFTAQIIDRSGGTPDYQCSYGCLDYGTADRQECAGQPASETRRGLTRDQFTVCRALLGPRCTE